MSIQRTTTDPAKPRDRGARMTMYESVQLGQKLEAARTQPEPIPWRDLSRQLGIPERTLQHQWSRHQERKAVIDDPTRQLVIHETLHLYEEILRELAEEVVNADNSAARIGALRTMIDLLERRGVNLNLFRTQEQVREDREGLVRDMQSFVDVLVKAKLPDALVDELRALVAQTAASADATSA